MSATFSAIPTPTRSPATSGCAARPSSIRWAGTTTACRPSRRVQNYYGVRCDPSLPFDPDFQPPDTAPSTTRSDVGRRNFIELCRHLVAADEVGVRGAVSPARVFPSTGTTSTRPSTTVPRRFAAWRSCAIWRAARPTRQEAPTLWDVDFRTAVAQAELEDREHARRVPPLAFHRADGAGT